jgi:UDP-N-acetylglucosamine--N-acetylmuramyl-(pentapeptide) pyrophosphoryl-undecaprenol N-acetylglucosamine transferase
MTGTVLIAAGGTGGHLYPAIAVADAIRKEHPGIRIVFVGTDRIESREVPRAGYEFHQIDIQAPGRSFKSMATFPFQLSKAVLDAMRLISRERPIAMLSGGAYLSVPVGIAAWSFHVPIALLEINSVAGSANKLLARVAQKLFVAYRESLDNFPPSIRREAIVSGTPVRSDLGSNPTAPEAARAAFDLEPGRKTALVFGGSLGARALNEAMETTSTALADAGYNVLWQTGKGNVTEELDQRYRGNRNVRVQEYIFEMEKAYAAADIVVCRAGASSLAEISKLGKPAILVPYPHAAANHQEANARAYESAGAAIVIRDPELGSRLTHTLMQLLSDEPRLRTMASAMASQAHEDAATVIAQWLISQGRNSTEARSEERLSSV